MKSNLPKRLWPLFGVIALVIVSTDAESQTAPKPNTPRTAPAALPMRDLPPPGTQWTDAQVIDFVQSLTEINSIPTLYERLMQVRELGKSTRYDELTESLRSNATTINYNFERLDAAVQQDLALYWSYRQAFLNSLPRARGGEPLALKSMRAAAQRVSIGTPIEMQLALLHFGQEAQELQSKCTAQPADTLCRSLLAMIREGDPKMAAWHARTYTTSLRVGSGAATAYTKYQDFWGGADYGAWVKWALANASRGDTRQLSLVHLVVTADVREAPAIIELAASRFKSSRDEKVAVIALLEQARAVKQVMETDPATARVIDQVQSMRREWVTLGGRAAFGDAQALERLQGLGTRLASVPAAKGIEQLSDSFSSFLEDQYAKNRTGDIDSKGYFLLMSRFTLQAAKDVDAEFAPELMAARQNERYRAAMDMVDVVTSGDQEREARAAWSRDHCILVSDNPNGGLGPGHEECR